MVDLEPAVGTEANKTRPAVVVSGDSSNASVDRHGRGMITIVPVTSSTERILPFHVLLLARDTGLRLDSKAQAEQVRSLDVSRVGRRVGIAPTTSVRALDDALRIHLEL